jgi:RNA polymerase sigma factor (sigma-70 family)
MPESVNLDILVKKCLKDDIKAQKKLYDMYQPLVFGVIRRYISDINIAKEILNEAFFSILTKLNQYSFKGAFEGWIRQIAVNCVAMYFRKNLKHDVISNLDISEVDFSIDSSAVGKITYKEILQFIHELPDMQRVIFNLHVFENFSHKKIGDVLDIKENNSRWYLNDARKRLKEKIKNNMPV